MSAVTAASLRAADSIPRGKARHSIGLEVRPGYVFPTHNFFRGDNATGHRLNTTLATHLKYAFRFAPGSRLGRLYPYAYQGVGLAYNTFFDRDELGMPVAVYVFQGSRIARLAPRLSLDYEWNFGLSLGWKESDELTNPYNRVVGSPANAYIDLGVFLSWQLASAWQLTAGVDLAHYSNGNTNYPNAGVNTASLRVGLTHTFGATSADDAPDFRPDPLHIAPHFSYDFIVYGSTRKRGLVKADGTGELIPGRFAVLGLNFNPMYAFNKYFRAGVSLDAQYDESANLRDYLVEGTDGPDMKFYRPPFREQFVVGLSARAELNMPIFSVNIGVGHNLFAHGDTRGFYQILALKAFVTRHAFLHVGYQLSKFQYPNNLMLGLGWRFGS